MNGRDIGPAAWYQTSLEELRQLRRNALEFADRCDAAAAESRRQADMYAATAAQLSKKAAESHSSELTRKADENSQMSDKRIRAARLREEEASKQRSIAIRLNAFIDRREGHMGR